MNWKNINQEEPSRSGQYLCIVLMPQFGRFNKEIQLVTFNIPDENPNGGGDGRICRLGVKGYEIVNTNSVWNTSGIVTHWDYIPELP